MNALLFLLFHGLLGAAPENPSTPPPAETTEAAKAAADLALLAEVRRIATRVETIRGVRFPAQVVAVRTTGDGIAATRALRANRLLPEIARGPRGRAWADLGLGTPDLPSRLVERITADVGIAAIDSETGQVRIASGALEKQAVLKSTTSEAGPGQEEAVPPSAAPEADRGNAEIAELTGIDPDEVLVAHALVHLLQRGRGDASTERATTDRMVTEAAWAEGEANLLAVRYIFEAVGIGEGVVRYNIDPEELLGGALAGEPVDTLPAAGKSLARFVVQEGYARVVEAYRKGGWKAVERFSSSLRSSRDLLHPDRAAAVPRQEPGTPPTAALVLADTDVLGEEGVITFVSVLTGKDDLALVAGDGWNGDSLERWEHPEGTSAGIGVTVWKTAWASPSEAEEFAYAFGRSMEDGVGASRPDPAATVWIATDRVYRMTRNGNAVTIRVASTELDRLMEHAGQEKPAEKPKPAESAKPKVKKPQ